MSWLSELTGIHISAPPAIQHLGDVLVNNVISAIPGGSQVNNVLDLTNQHGGYNVSDAIAQAERNIQAQLNGAMTAASTIGTVQSAGQDVSSAFTLLARNPVVLVMLAVIAFVVLRKR